MKTAGLLPPLEPDPALPSSRAAGRRRISIEEPA
jgi:hypothetical protein